MKQLIRAALLRLSRKNPMPIYTTFDQACADSHTYQDPGVIDIVARKTQALRQSLPNKEKTAAGLQTIQNMFVLTYVHPGQRLDVLEVGGACGATYLELAHLLSERIDHWHIVETPAMTAVGKSQFQNDRVLFFDDIQLATVRLARRDLLMAQGVLQYTSDPLHAWHSWLALQFDFVYLTRTQIVHGIPNPIITKQVVNLSAHGTGVAPRGFIDRKTSQPLTLIPYESLVGCIPANYRIVLSFDEGVRVPATLPGQTVRTQMVGLLLRRVDE